MMSQRDELVAIWPPNRRIVSITKPCRALADGVEDKLNVGRGASNCAKDFASHRLLLTRLVALAGKLCDLRVSA
jgi:hypothetical protein